MKAKVVFYLIVLAFAFASGMVFGGSELANPWTAQKKAALIEAQTKLIEAQTKDMEAETQIKLETAEEEQPVRLEALRKNLEAQQAQEAEHRERWFQLKALGLMVLVATSAAAIVMLGGAGAYYIACAARALQPAPKVVQPDRRVIPFPGLLQRARALANNTAFAAALWVVAITVVTANVVL